MKCPKCQYVSHDYLDTCRKCGVDLVAYKQQMGLLVLQPGELDLSLVFAGSTHEDLFGSLTESGLMPADDDEADFDISLEDAMGRPGMQWPYAQPQRAGAADGGGLDHLTLELDAAGLPPELLASASRDLASSSSAPPPPPARSSERARGLPSPSEHLTLEMEAPRGGLHQPSRGGPGSPPPAVRPAASTQEMPESRPPSTPLTLSSQGIEFGRQAPDVSQHAPQTPPPTSQTGLGVTATALGAAALGAAAAGALSSVPPAAEPVPPAPVPRSDDFSIPVVELIETDSSSERSSASPAGSVDMDLDSFALSADSPPFADISPSADREPPNMDFLQSIETSGVESSEPLVDVPLGDDTLELSYSEEEMAASFRQDTSSASSGRTTDVVFTPSDMRVLESMVDDGDRGPSHLTVELDISNMDLGTPFSLVEPPLMGQTSLVPEASTGPALTPSDMRALGGEGKGDEDIPPGHLTLELDAEEFETSLDAHRLQGSQPHSTLAREQPPAEPPEGDDEVLLDLDDIALESDEQS